MACVVAQELLEERACHHDVFFAGQDKYRNLAYALVIAELAYKESRAYRYQANKISAQVRRA